MKKKIITDFLGTMKAIKLNFGTHNGLLYRVYQNQVQVPITLRVISLVGFTICN